MLSIVLLRQKITFKSILAIFISFVGVVVISTHGAILGFRFTNLNGALLALGSAVVWALFWTYNIKDSRDEVAKLFLNFLFGCVFVLILIICAKQSIAPQIPGFIGAVYVGIFEMGITFVLWLKALKLSKTTAQVSNLIYLVPFLSLVVINIVVGEKILVSTIIGLVFVISGIILQQYAAHSSLRVKTDQ